MSAAHGARPSRPATVDKFAATLLVLLCTLSFLLLAGGFWRWPWDHDEVLSFAELRVIPVDAFPGPHKQLLRMRSLLPVWYHAQRLALRWLPHDEFGARVLPVSAAVMLVAFSVWWVRRRGLTFAAAVALLVGCSPMLIWLAQQNRFYSLALCLMAAALLIAGSGRQGWTWDALVAALCLGALLSHNLTVVVFVLAFAAAVGTAVIGGAPPFAIRRTAIMACLGAGTYPLLPAPVAEWVDKRQHRRHSANRVVAGAVRARSDRVRSTGSCRGLGGP